VPTAYSVRLAPPEVVEHLPQVARGRRGSRAWTHQGPGQAQRCCFRILTWRAVAENFWSTYHPISLESMSSPSSSRMVAPPLSGPRRTVCVVAGVAAIVMGFVSAASETYTFFAPQPVATVGHVFALIAQRWFVYLPMLAGGIAAVITAAQRRPSPVRLIIWLASLWLVAYLAILFVAATQGFGPDVTEGVTLRLASPFIAIGSVFVASISTISRKATIT
jgi:hypothetical protein